MNKTRRGEAKHIGKKENPDSGVSLTGRRYQIGDKAHARNAVARVSRKGAPAEYTFCCTAWGVARFTI